jgi:hypothetical protein
VAKLPISRVSSLERLIAGSGLVGLLTPFVAVVLLLVAYRPGRRAHEHAGRPIGGKLATNGVNQTTSGGSSHTKWLGSCR